MGRKRSRSRTRAKSHGSAQAESQQNLDLPLEAPVAVEEPPQTQTTAPALPEIEEYVREEAKTDESEELTRPSFVEALEPETLASERPTDTGDLDTRDLHAIAVLSAIDENTEFSGELLKKVREAKGITLEDISYATKVAISTIRAIEAERFEDLPQVRVYIRGFVQCIAQEVGLNPERVAKSFLRRWDTWEQSPRESRKH